MLHGLLLNRGKEINHKKFDTCLIYSINYSGNTQEEIALKFSTESKHPYVDSTSNLSSLTNSRDEELLTFLNTPNSSPKKNIEVSMSPPTPSSLMVEHPTDTTDSISELSNRSDCSSSSPMHTSVELPDNFNYDDVEIKNEITDSVNNESIENHSVGIVLDNGNLKLVYYLNLYVYMYSNIIKF